MHSFSANSKGEEALLHPQNSYSQVIQKKDEGVDKKMENSKDKTIRFSKGFFSS